MEASPTWSGGLSLLSEQRAGYYAPQQEEHELIIHTIDTVNPVVEYRVSEVSKKKIKNYVQTLQDSGTRFVFTDECNESAEYLYNQFLSYGLQVEYDYFKPWGERTQNVVATLPGIEHPSREYTGLI